MGPKQFSKMYNVVGDHIKFAAMAVFLGFGLGACSGSDESVEEPIQSEETAAANNEGLPGVSDQQVAVEDFELDSAASNAAATPTPAGNGANGSGEAVSGFLESASSTTAATAPAAGTASPSVPSTASSPGMNSSTPAVPAGEGQYVVQKGDTLSKIARRIFGEKDRWQEMATLNQLKAPYMIRPGDTLRFSASNAKSQEFANKYNSVMQESSVTVQKGDTLSKIARRVLGDSHAWKVLFAYNKDKISNPDRIEVGMVLKYLPLAKLKTMGANANNDASGLASLSQQP